MRVAVIGSKSLSVHVLESLIKSQHEVLAVYTRDDEPGMKVWHEVLHHPSLKERAKAKNIPVYEGMKVNSTASLQLLESLDLDIIFSCFWSEIFREPVLNIPKLGVFNLHTALLPLNRGSRPIPWAMINEEPEAGITLHKMMTGVDNGPIVHQKSVLIGEKDNAKAVYDKVIEAGKTVFDEALIQFEKNTYSLRHQPEGISTYQPRGEPYGGQLNPYWPQSKQNRFKAAFSFPPFRGTRPYPCMTEKLIYTISVLGENAEQLPDRLCKTEPNAKFSIGNKWERRGIKRQWELFPADKTAVVIKRQDLQHNFPLLDIIQRSGTCGISLVQLKPSELETESPYQPFRYKNGLLEFPHFLVKHSTDLYQLFTQVTKHLDQSKRTLFIHLLIESDKDLEKLAQDQLIKLNGIERTFLEVCQIFDTDYETLST